MRVQEIHPVFSDSLFVKVRITKSEFFSAQKQDGKDEHVIQWLYKVKGECMSW